MNIISTGYLHTEVILLIRKIFNSVKRKDGKITSKCKKNVLITLVYTEVLTQKFIIYYNITSINHLLLQTVQH